MGVIENLFGGVVVVVEIEVQGQVEVVEGQLFDFCGGGDFVQCGKVVGIFDDGLDWFVVGYGGVVYLGGVFYFWQEQVDYFGVVVVQCQVVGMFGMFCCVDLYQYLGFWCIDEEMLEIGLCFDFQFFFYCIFEVDDDLVGVVGKGFGDLFWVGGWDEQCVVYDLLVYVCFFILF